jgi:signal transduction histidine kinase
MNDIAMLEDALRAHLNRRCRRAYAHELRNGMQGIFGGVDALTRAARATKPLTVPLDQLTQFVQQAIANHERGLERVLESMAPENHAPALVSLREMLMEQVRFMTNDTARHSARIRQDFGDDMKVHAAPARLRLITLGLLTESIDAMPNGGEIRIGGRTHGDRVQFEVADERTQPRPASFVHEAIERLVVELSGEVEYEKDASCGYAVRVALPAADRSS